MLGVTAVYEDALIREERKGPCNPAGPAGCSKGKQQALSAKRTKGS